MGPPRDFGDYGQDTRAHGPGSYHPPTAAPHARDPSYPHIFDYAPLPPPPAHHAPWPHPPEFDRYGHPQPYQNRNYYADPPPGWYSDPRSRRRGANNGFHHRHPPPPHLHSRYAPYAPPPSRRASRGMDPCASGYGYGYGYEEQEQQQSEVYHSEYNGAASRPPDAPSTSAAPYAALEEPSSQPTLSTRAPAAAAPALPAPALPAPALPAPALPAPALPAPALPAPALPAPALPAPALPAPPASPPTAERLIPPIRIPAKVWHPAADVPQPKSAFSSRSESASAGVGLGAGRRRGSAGSAASLPRDGVSDPATVGAAAVAAGAALASQQSRDGSGAGGGETTRGTTSTDGSDGEGDADGDDDNAVGAGAVEAHSRTYHIFTRETYTQMVRCIELAAQQQQETAQRAAAAAASSSSSSAVSILTSSAATKALRRLWREVAATTPARKRWKRLQNNLQVFPDRGEFRCLAWRNSTLIIVPHEDWPAILDEAHRGSQHVNEHASARQTMISLRHRYETRRSRCGITADVVDSYCHGCACYRRLSGIYVAGFPTAAAAAAAGISVLPSAPSPSIITPTTSSSAVSCPSAALVRGRIRDLADANAMVIIVARPRGG
ncbi:hypothetical protein H9P43_009799 [Blastocladiella emersonii ATCC 22665]|nr:hypothetical protein H9P43_009799 [Blastocladiella emersonii ATCC 22665]